MAGLLRQPFSRAMLKRPSRESMDMRERSHCKVVGRHVWLRKSTRTLTLKVTAAFLLLTFTTIALHGNWITALFLIGGGMGIWQLLEAHRLRYLRTTLLQDIETMSESQFLHYAAELFRSQGYGVLKASQSDDRRVDLLLMKGEESFACKLLRDSGRVKKAKLVRVLTGMQMHGCRRSMIVANQAVTSSARRAARQADCVLIDRDGLTSLVAQYRQGHRVYVFHREEIARLRKRK